HYLAVAGRAMDASRRSLRQIRYCTANRAEEKRGPTLRDLLRMLPEDLEPEVRVVTIAPALWPLTHATLHYPGVGAVELAGLRYWEAVSNTIAGRPNDLPRTALPLYALLARRARAISTARAAFEREAEDLGDAFNPGSVEARLHVHILVCEMAALIGSWSERPSERVAFAAAA